MNRIKFIYETRSKRIFMSVLSACILILTAIGLLVDKGSSGFFFGVATGGVLYIILELASLFLNRNFVYIGHNYLLIRINRFFFKTLLLDHVESVNVSDTIQQIHLKERIIEVRTEGIAEQDVNQLQVLILKLAEA